MPLHIGDKKLIPAPVVTLRKNIIFAGDGSPLNSNYQITLDGTLLPNRGSPTSVGWYTTVGEPDAETYTSDVDRFNSILRKQEWLKEGLSATGYKLSWSAGGEAPIECYPKLLDINFEPGTWVVLCPYTVTLEAPYIDRVGTTDDELIYVTGYQGRNLTAANDDYQIKERDDGRPILEVSRTISATSAFRGSASGLNEPWQYAKDWVMFRKEHAPFGSGVFFVNTTGILLASGQSYNLVEEESINKLGGQYSLTQRFTYHYQNYIDTRTVSKNLELNRLGDGGASPERITINGEVIGLDPYNIPTSKYANASGYFYSILNTLGVSVGAVGAYLTRNITEDYDNGTIKYDLEYINNSGQYYKHAYDVNYTVGDNLPTATINGTIEGYTPDDMYSGVGANYTKFDNAISGWRQVSGILHDLTFAYIDLLPTGALFSEKPSNYNVSFNKALGTVGYSATFVYTSGVSTNYQHIFNIDLSTDNGPSDVTKGGLLVTASLNGQIVGLQDGTDPNSRLNNARVGWLAVRPTLLTLANAEYNLIGSGSTPPLASGFVRRTVTTDQRGGSISYNVTFNNIPRPSSSLVAIEDVIVEDTNPSMLFAVQNIPGRLAGPIIQNINTVSERRRTVNISLTMLPNTVAPYKWNYSDLSTISPISSGLVASVMPTGDRGVNWWIAGDTENWNFKGGLYTRNVSFVF